ncbi:MAG: DUF721 domain-containing protein, partial [Alphaproteobacteria bacterium]|nr:DUF721 domain-containing protein [Alphaproteobacteria bacterium]
MAKGDDPHIRRHSGPRPLASLTRRMTEPAFRRQGFAQQDIVTRWAQIVGPALGETSLPEKLNFPPGKRRGGTLIVRVEGGMALELQHLAPQVIERVNSYFGY